MVSVRPGSAFGLALSAVIACLTLSKSVTASNSTHQNGGSASTKELLERFTTAPLTAEPVDLKYPAFALLRQSTRISSAHCANATTPVDPATRAVVLVMSFVCCALLALSLFSNGKRVPTRGRAAIVLALCGLGGASAALHGSEQNEPEDSDNWWVLYVLILAFAVIRMRNWRNNPPVYFAMLLNIIPFCSANPIRSPGIEIDTATFALIFVMLGALIVFTCIAACIEFSCCCPSPTDPRASEERPPTPPPRYSSRVSAPGIWTVSLVCIVGLLCPTANGATYSNQTLVANNGKKVALTVPYTVSANFTWYFNDSALIVKVGALKAHNFKPDIFELKRNSISFIASNKTYGYYKYESNMNNETLTPLYFSVSPPTCIHHSDVSINVNINTSCSISWKIKTGENTLQKIAEQTLNGTYTNPYYLLKNYTLINGSLIFKSKTKFVFDTYELQITEHSLVKTRIYTVQTMNIFYDTEPCNVKNYNGLKLGFQTNIYYNNSTVATFYNLTNRNNSQSLKFIQFDREEITHTPHTETYIFLACSIVICIVMIAFMIYYLKTHPVSTAQQDRRGRKHTHTPFIALMMILTVFAQTSTALPVQPLTSVCYSHETTNFNLLACVILLSLLNTAFQILIIILLRRVIRR